MKVKNTLSGGGPGSPRVCHARLPGGQGMPHCAPATVLVAQASALLHPRSVACTMSSAPPLAHGMHASGLQPLGCFRQCTIVASGSTSSRLEASIHPLNCRVCVPFCEPPRSECTPLHTAKQLLYRWRHTQLPLGAAAERVGKAAGLECGPGQRGSQRDVLMALLGVLLGHRTKTKTNTNRLFD